ncbi:uncharacterized protein LOC112138208 [Oryzias melastigma]|uniref:uncharacterized protein LOC112138208 n=1 Tax=Oryzias melastigma TaxID=30732 RepID=UPI000CF7C93F|nr:uncharacterized protein LOC112138208 [Oryzias melastigma]
MAAILRVVFGEDDASKLSLPNGIPSSVECLKEEIRRQFDLSQNFRLQYRDIEFNNEFVNLTLTSEIQNKSTVKVVYLPLESVVSLHDTVQGTDAQSSSTSVDDTDIPSLPKSHSSYSSLRSLPWPTNFQIPEFSYEVQVQLERGQQAFLTSGTLLHPSTKLKSDILESLASEIIKYKMYPSNTEFDNVAEALTTKYPCLKEQGSVCGYYGWKISLKYKMANYRTRLRNIGCQELIINGMKEKRVSMTSSPNQVKKPRKAEVNFCPDYPAGETKESLEEEREALVLEVKKKNNKQLIQRKMEQTFAYRRQEIIKDMPFIAEVKNRWPALFSETEIIAEFTRITTVPLLSTFISKLDFYSNHLLRVFKKKGGAAKVNINFIMAAMDENSSIDVKRECILKSTLRLL